MKREGRQRGMVKTHAILPNPLHPRPETRHVYKLDSPPTAGSFTRVPTKPISHSKFTGKCGLARCNACHLNPAHKAKTKTKGHQKTVDVATDHHLLTWHSASGILDQLAFDYYDDYY